MDAKHLEHFKSLLYDEMERTNEILNGIKENMGLEESLKDNTSELSSYDNHPADLGSETFEIEKNRALKANEVTHMKKIEDALNRIENGQYGICEICKKEIDYERLKAVPYATLCASCESERGSNYDHPQDRPVEESVNLHPFGEKSGNAEDYTGYDGEDVWQELTNYDSPNYMLLDDEDEDRQGIVEETDKISNEQYKKQLGD